MTARERWHAVLARRKPDRLPMDYWATPEATQRLLAHVGCADEWALYRWLGIDRLSYLTPRYVGPPLPADQNYYGCRYAQVPYGAPAAGQGVYEECVGHPLAECRTIADIERMYTWPSPDWFDYAGLPARLHGRADYPVGAGHCEPFLVYCELRGLELAFKDLVARPAMVEHCLARLFDFEYQRNVRIYEALRGRVDVSYVAEDFGAQDRLLFSPQMIRRYFLPGMQRMVDLAHQAGAKVMTHSDGAIRPIIPDLVAMGVDILNPIQWRCAGMDRAALQRDFGAQLIFHGGVDNQQTLAFGTPADVEREVLDNVRLLGARGNYILAPCHNIQAITPPENVMALYETGRRCTVSQV
ncbi:MAG: uroporphyrinogen decarboxylase family protein [Planctomycetota bacterium]